MARIIVESAPIRYSAILPDGLLYSNIAALFSRQRFSGCLPVSGSLKTAAVFFRTHLMNKYSLLLAGLGQRLLLAAAVLALLYGVYLWAAAA